MDTQDCGRGRLACQGALPRGGRRPAIPCRCSRWPTARCTSGVAG